MLNHLAQNTIDIIPEGSFTSTDTWTVAGILSAVITLIMVFAGLLFFFMLLLGGIKWLTSGGDKAQTEAARNQITAALIGLVIVFAAFAILQLLEQFFGIDLTALTIPSVTT